MLNAEQFARSRKARAYLNGAVTKGDKNRAAGFRAAARIMLAGETLPEWMQGKRAGRPRKAAGGNPQ